MTILSGADLLARYAEGQRDFRGVDIDDGSDPLSGADLRGADFTGAYIVADLAGAKLQDCVFREANVKTCVFDGSDLTGATFQGAALCGATFEDATLTGAQFEGAFYHDYVFGADELPPC